MGKIRKHSEALILQKDRCEIDFSPPPLLFWSKLKAIQQEGNGKNQNDCDYKHWNDHNNDDKTEKQIIRL